MPYVVSLADVTVAMLVCDKYWMRKEWWRGNVGSERRSWGVMHIGVPCRSRPYEKVEGWVTLRM